MENDLLSEEKLQQVLELMKNRREIDHPVNYEAIRETTVLLVDGILLKLMNYIARAIEIVSASKILESTESSLNNLLHPSGAPQMSNNNNLEKLDQLNWNVLRLSAETIFFALYQTQIEVEEAKLLLELIHMLSDLLSKTLDDFSNASIASLALAAGSTTPSPAQVKSHVTTSFLYILIVLQLSHVCAHQQIAKLLSRRKNYYNKKSFEIEPGNLLPQKRGSKYGLDRQAWKCSGVKGFTNLVFAVFRQPEVDEGKAPKEDVEWFMHEACVLRGYSYIRLCLLPLIRTSAIVKYEYSLFFVAVIAELLENLAKVFVFSHYDHNENDFPYIFFPPTMDFYVQNIHFYQGVLEEYDHSRMSPFKRTPNASVMMNISVAGPETLHGMVLEVDTLQDVLNLYIDLLHYYPSFATVFWGDLDPEEEAISEALLEDDELLTQRLQAPLHEFHPFLTKVIESTQHHRHLLLDTLRLLTALGNGPKHCTARLVYCLIAEGYLNRMDWDRIVDKISRFIHEFISEEGQLFTTIGGRHPSNPTTTTTSSSTSLVTTVRSISPIDLEGILIFVELIGMISQRKAVANQFVTQYQLLPKLFSLLSCPIPIEIKGSILTTLSIFAKYRKYHLELWQLLEQSGLCASFFVPISTPTATTNTTGTGGSTTGFGFGLMNPTTPDPIKPPATASVRYSLKGIKAELEENEVRTGRYPVTLGFLILIRNLLQTYEEPTESSPNTGASTASSGVLPLHLLGSGQRIPGILPYIEYIVEEIFMKIHERYYYPEDSLNVITQRWRLTCYCLEIFNALLQLYPIHHYDRQWFLQTLFQRSPQSQDGNATETNVNPHVQDFKEDYLPIPTTRLTASTSTALVVAGGGGGGFSGARSDPSAATNSSNPSKRYKVPKTPGFYLLAMMLNNSKFTELLMKIITTVDRQYLLQGLQSYTMHELVVIYEIYKYGFVHYKLRSRLGFLFTMKDRFLPYVSSQYYGVTSSESSSHDFTTELHLSDAKTDPLATNTVFWLERALMNSLLFLYEVLVREAAFRFYVTNCHSSLCLTKYDFTRRYQMMPTLPLHPFPLLEIMMGYGVTSKLLPLLSFEWMTLPSIPIPNIIIINIVELILLQKPYASIFTTSTLEEANRSSSATNSSNSSSHRMEMSQIIESFVHCLLVQKDFPSYLYDEYHYYYYAREASHYHIYWDRSQYGVQSPVLIPALMQKALLTTDDVNDTAGSSGIVVNVNHSNSYGSMRAAVISMMLNTLVTSTPSTTSSSMGGGNTFIHTLLGVQPGAASALFMNSSSRLFPMMPEAAGPSMDCLTALLQVISPSHGTIPHFFLRYPDQSLMIYELLYRLTATPATRRGILSRLRQMGPSHSFLIEHFQYFLQLLVLSKEELLKMLLEMDVLSLTTAQPSATEFPSSEASPTAAADEIQQRIIMKIYELHTAINHAVSYLLKIFAADLSLTFFGLHPSGMNGLPTPQLIEDQHYTTLKTVLELLFYQSSMLSVGEMQHYATTTSRGGGSEERGGSLGEERMNLLQLLYYSFHEEEITSLPESVQASILELLDPHYQYNHINPTDNAAVHSQYKQLPVITAIIKQSMVKRSSSSRTTTTFFDQTNEYPSSAETIVTPFYRCIAISEVAKKLQEVLTPSPPTTPVTTSGPPATSVALVPRNAMMIETESLSHLVENVVKVSVLFNQQEKLKASRNHLVLAIRQVLDCCFLPSTTTTTTTTTKAPAVSGEASETVPIVMKILLELHAEHRGGGGVGGGSGSSRLSMIREVKGYFLQELLLPLVKFTRHHLDSLDPSLARPAILKSLITSIAFISNSPSRLIILETSTSTSNSSNSNSSNTRDDEQVSVWIFAWKELLEELYQLLMMITSTTAPATTTTGSTSTATNPLTTATSLISLHLPYYQQILQLYFLQLTNTTATGFELPFNPPIGSGMAVKGSLVMAIQLTLKLLLPTYESKGRGVKSTVIQAMTNTIDTSSSKSTSTAADLGMTEEEKKSSFSPGGGRSSSRRRSEVYHHLQLFFQQHLISLLDGLLSLTTEGELRFQVNAIYTLSTILQLLVRLEEETTTSSIMSSRLLIKAIQFMTQQGYLKKLWQHCVGMTNTTTTTTTTTSNTATVTMIATSGTTKLTSDQLLFYHTTLQFCHQLIRLVVVTESNPSVSYHHQFDIFQIVLIDTGLLEHLTFSSLFSTLLSDYFGLLTTTNTTTPTNHNNTNNNSPSMDRYVAIIQETLALLMTIFTPRDHSLSSRSSRSISSVDKGMMECVIQFYQRHREGLSKLLQLPLQSMIQLELVETVTGFFFLFIQQVLVYLDNHHNTISEGGGGGIAPKYQSHYQKLWNLFGKDLEILLSDGLHLLQVFGAAGVLIPSLLMDFYHPHKTSSTSTTTTTTTGTTAMNPIQSYFAKKPHVSRGSPPTVPAWWSGVTMAIPSLLVSNQRRAQEQSWQGTTLMASLSPASPSSTASSVLVPSQWTLFDQLKVEKSLNILFNVSNLFRMIAVPAQSLPSSGGGGDGLRSMTTTTTISFQFQYFPLSLWLHLFRESVALMMQCQYFHDGIAHQQSSSRSSAEPVLTDPERDITSREQRWQWLASYRSTPEFAAVMTLAEGAKQAVVPSMFIQLRAMMIAENAIITIYYLISQAMKEKTNATMTPLSSNSFGQQVSWSEEEMKILNELFQMGDLLPTYSFCRIVLKWIYEEVSSQ